MFGPLGIWNPLPALPKPGGGWNPPTIPGPGVIDDGGRKPPTMPGPTALGAMLGGGTVTAPPAPSGS
jgi:hypothetical protein